MATDIDLHLGRRLRRRRRLLGLTQQQLAMQVGIRFQQIQKYEKGANRISASKLWDIARFFKVDIGYFFEGLSGAQLAGVPLYPPLCSKGFFLCYVNVLLCVM